ncbi:MAG: hypothetical protein M3O62_14555 [Pseudomonadota bacterium]|nr:hypothetical protein [Pseudomonadota bacterium]
MTHKRIHFSARRDSFFSSHPETVHQHRLLSPDRKSFAHTAVTAGLALAVAAAAVVTGVLLVTVATTVVPAALLAHITVQFFSRHGGYL